MKHSPLSPEVNPPEKDPTLHALMHSKLKKVRECRYIAPGFVESLTWFTDENNAFAWEKIRLNLPGDENYNLALPWVSKVRHDGRLAADLVIYVGDLHTTGSDQELCWKVTRQAGLWYNHREIQDKGHKCSNISQQPGRRSLQVDLPREMGQDEDAHKMDPKWTKGWDLLDRNRLECICSFIVHVSRTYISMVPFLKGLHQAIDSWCPGRDADG